MYIDPYRLDPGQGSHDLMHALKSRRRWEYREDISDRPAVLLGSAAHCLILEPDEFDKRYRQPWTPPPGTVTTVDDITAVLRERKIKGYSGKKRDELIAMLAEHCPDVQTSDAARAEFEATDDRVELTDAQHETVIAINRAVRTDRQSAALLDAAIGFEVPAYWTDKHRGVRCKRKADILLRDGFADLKTCADPWKFVDRLRWKVDETLLQMLHYRVGGWMTRGFAENVYIIAVGSAEPFDVIVCKLHEDVIDRATDNYRRAINNVKRWQAEEVDAAMGIEQPIDPSVVGVGHIVEITTEGPAW